jgi:hypothetical protein
VLFCSWLGLLLGGCEPAGEVSGSYMFPTAVIGVSPKSDEAASDVRRRLAVFAAEHHLHRYRLSEDKSAPEYMRRDPRSMRSTDFIPDPPDATHGLGLELVEYSPQCWVIRFMERSEAWTTESLGAFENLASRLSDVSEARSTVLVRPKHLQNAAEARERHPDRDWEQEQYEGEFCARMGVR